MTDYTGCMKAYEILVYGYTIELELKEQLDLGLSFYKTVLQWQCHHPGGLYEIKSKQSL